MNIEQLREFTQHMAKEDTPVRAHIVEDGIKLRHKGKIEMIKWKQVIKYDSNFLLIKAMDMIMEDELPF